MRLCWPFRSSLRRYLSIRRRDERNGQHTWVRRWVGAKHELHALGVRRVVGVPLSQVQGVVRQDVDRAVVEVVAGSGDATCVRPDRELTYDHLRAGRVLSDEGRLDVEGRDNRAQFILGEALAFAAT